MERDYVSTDGVYLLIIYKEFVFRFRRYFKRQKYLPYGGIRQHYKMISRAI
jgi:hypothetical protein